MKKILLLAGTKSFENEISLKSGYFILKHGLLLKEYQWVPLFLDNKNSSIPFNFDAMGLDPLYKKYISLHDIKWPLRKDILKNLDIDIIFPVIHGGLGENGKLQAYFDLLDIKYVGNTMLPSALSIDKPLLKYLMKALAIPNLDFSVLYQNYWQSLSDQLKQEYLNDLILNLNFPLFIKPSNTGSSIGIEKVKDFNSLKESIEKAFDYSKVVLIEKAIDCREIEIAFLENNGNFLFTEAGEVLYSEKADFYDYQAKYFLDYCSPIIPAEISLEQKELIKNYTKKLFQTIRGRGFARADFFIDKKTNALYFNEINTMPGFTHASIFPKLFNQKKLKPDQLIAKMIESTFTNLYD